MKWTAMFKGVQKVCII